MAYGKMHRFFLRTVASQGVLSITEAQTVLERFNGEEELSVTDLVRAINDEIRPYSQEIKITKDEVTNEDVIVFLSVADDVATKAQNIFSSTELEYFRVLIEQIMSTESRQITGINAMNLVSSMKSSFTKTDAQKVLNTWCRMRYFDKEQDNYALGVRAIHEFEGYFRQNMEHAVEECFLCKHIVFRGYNCPGCGQAIHTRCLMRYLEKVQKWPCCKIDFEHEQLERLNNEGSRLPPTQLLDTTRNSEENNTEQPQSTEVQESSEMMDGTQDIIPEISQRVTRKRKRQTVPQTEVPTTTRKNAVIQPTQAPTTHRLVRHNAVADNTEPPTTRRSVSENAAVEPTGVPNTRRSVRNNIVAESTQTPTTQHSVNSVVAEPTKVPTPRRSISKDAVAKPTQATTTRRSTRSNIKEEPVTDIEESFENMEVTDVPKVTQRVMKKRKQQI